MTKIDRESVDPLHVKGPNGITRRVDEHYFVPSDVQQDPHGAWLAIQNLCAALNKAEARADSAAQEARAVALEEAAEIPLQYEPCAAPDAIRALIDTPAAEALEQVRAEAYLSGWVNGSNGIEPPDFGNPVFEKAPGD